MRKTEVKIAQSSNHILHGDSVLSIGSCFGENISEKLLTAGFDVFSNPFGVVFNPISLATCLSTSAVIKEDSILQREDIYLSWEANSKIYGTNKGQFFSELKKTKESLLEKLKTTKFLFITFGTAYVYEHIVLDRIVANCHKIPQKEFRKRLLKPAEIVAAWRDVVLELRKLNPSIQIVFTVSPVRHVKDGLVENNRSKAVLFNAISELETLLSVGYFPAYEIVNDELRDYAYFGADGVHPNQYAVTEVWSRFQNTYFSEETRSIVAKVNAFKSFFSHKSLHPASKASLHALEKQKRDLALFLEAHPNLKY